MKCQSERSKGRKEARNEEASETPEDEPVDAEGATAVENEHSLSEATEEKIEKQPGICQPIKNMHTLELASQFQGVHVFDSLL